VSAEVNSKVPFEVKNRLPKKVVDTINQDAADAYSAKTRAEAAATSAAITVSALEAKHPFAVKAIISHRHVQNGIRMDGGPNDNPILVHAPEESNYVVSEPFTGTHIATFAVLNGKDFSLNCHSRFTVEDTNDGKKYVMAHISGIPDKPFDVMIDFITLYQE
jgi:hypothetical protein